MTAAAISTDKPRRQQNITLRIIIFTPEKSENTLQLNCTTNTPMGAIKNF